MPTEWSTTNQTPPTDERVQGDLLRDYGRKFANLPVYLQLTKTLFQCRSREHSIWKHHVESTLCLEVTNHLMWKDGFVEKRRLVVCYHQGRYEVEIMIESLFGHKTCSCQDRKRNEQIRNADVGRDSRWKYWREEHRETCCEGKTTKVIRFNVVSCICSVPWTKVDWRGIRNNRLKLSGGIQIDDQISSTWWLSKSRRWRSSKVRRLGINVSIKNYVFFALVNSNMAGLLAKRRWN